MASIAPTANEPFLFGPRVVLLVALSFMPLAAIPVGDNTNVPLSSLVALTFLPVVMQHLRLALLLMVVLVGPLAQTLALTLVGQDPNLAAAVAWGLHAAPLVGFAAIATCRASALITPLYWSLVSSCAYAVVQLMSIRSGSIPFIDMYELAGYASVRDQEFGIIAYIQRPFGWFPEPSFLAGTLALGTVLYLALRALQLRPLAGRDYALVGFVAFTIYLTESGSGVLTIGTILLLAVLPHRRSRWIPFVIVGLAIPSLKVGFDILSSRGSNDQNFSWGDRLGSLIASGQYVYDSTAGWLVGIGKGSLNERFLAGDIQVGSQGGQLLDTASVLLRLVYELGLPLGLLIIGSLAVAIVRSNREAVGALGAGLVLITWLVVAGATVTYDSAALTWAVPGVALGIQYLKPKAHIPQVQELTAT